MATVTHLPAPGHEQAHTYTCTDRQAVSALRQFEGTGFKVTRGTVDARDGVRECLDIVWSPRGPARILVARGVRS